MNGAWFIFTFAFGVTCLTKCVHLTYYQHLSNIGKVQQYGEWFRNEHKNTEPDILMEITERALEEADPIGNSTYTDKLRMMRGKVGIVKILMRYDSEQLDNNQLYARDYKDWVRGMLEDIVYLEKFHSSKELLVSLVTGLGAVAVGTLYMGITSSGS